MVNDCNFVYVLRLVRSEALRGMTAQEEAIVDEHFEYLKHALAEGRLGFAGRCLDGEFGIVLFRARSEHENYFRRSCWNYNVRTHNCFGIRTKRSHWPTACSNVGNSFCHRVSLRRSKERTDVRVSDPFHNAYRGRSHSSAWSVC